MLAWEKHEAGVSVFRGFRGDSPAARIFKRANHRTLDKDVYTVEVLGRELPAQIHEIADARLAGEAAYRKAKAAGSA